MDHLVARLEAHGTYIEVSFSSRHASTASTASTTRPIMIVCIYAIFM